MALLSGIQKSSGSLRPMTTIRVKSVILLLKIFVIYVAAGQLSSENL
jgi:hypothetical protein